MPTAEPRWRVQNPRAWAAPKTKQNCPQRSLDRKHSAPWVFPLLCSNLPPATHTHTLSHPLKLGTPGFPQKRFGISLSLVHRTCCADTRQAQLHFEDPESGSNKTTRTCELCRLLNSRLLIYNMRHAGCTSGLSFFSALARPACNAEQSRGPLVGERMGGDLTDS